MECAVRLCCGGVLQKCRWRHITQTPSRRKLLCVPRGNSPGWEARWQADRWSPAAMIGSIVCTALSDILRERHGWRLTSKQGSGHVEAWLAALCA